VTYRALAPHYDAIMAHVDYPGWARHLRGLWRTVRGRNREPARLLEIAAGTCRLAATPLFPKAFSVHTDLRHAMLATAAPSLRRAACDARALPFREGSFDLVLMVYDSLNYLTRPEEVRQAFDEAYRALAPDGVFLFDVTTEACSKRWFADTLDVQETMAGTSIRHSRYDAPTRTQLNLFTFFTQGPDGRFDRSEEVHRQRIWPASFLKKTAREAGFTVRACLADFTLKPGNDRHDRLHFVLQRP
jgi:SAM-dependent methyltransferase